MQHDLIIARSKNWIKEFVIKFNFCPFAKNVFVNESIRYTVDVAKIIEDHFEHLIMELQVLDHQPAIETSFILYPEAFTDFETYLDFFETANSLLEDLNYEGIYQLATFHPDYCFADAEQDDPANYTNRSPYPMLHILREAAVEEALEHYENPEEIPERNIEVARTLGLQKVKAIRGACFDLN